MSDRPRILVHADAARSFDADKWRSIADIVIAERGTADGVVATSAGARQVATLVVPAPPEAHRAFAARVFALARLRDLLANEPTAAMLGAFHARHKMQLLAHSPALMQAAGRAAAQAADNAAHATAAYAHLFRQALACDVTTGREANAFQHLAGHIRGENERRAIHLAIHTFRVGERSRQVVVEQLVEALADASPWARSQTLVAPWPEAAKSALDDASRTHPHENA